MTCICKHWPWFGLILSQVLPHGFRTGVRERSWEWGCVRNTHACICFLTSQFWEWNMQVVFRVLGTEHLKRYRGYVLEVGAWGRDSSSLGKVFFSAFLSDFLNLVANIPFFPKQFNQLASFKLIWYWDFIVKMRSISFLFGCGRSGYKISFGQNKIWINQM